MNPSVPRSFSAKDRDLGLFFFFLRAWQEKASTTEDTEQHRNRAVHAKPSAGHRDRDHGRPNPVRYATFSRARPTTDGHYSSSVRGPRATLVAHVPPAGSPAHDVRWPRVADDRLLKCDAGSHYRRPAVEARPCMSGIQPKLSQPPQPFQPALGLNDVSYAPLPHEIRAPFKNHSSTPQLFKAILPALLFRIP